MYLVFTRMPSGVTVGNSGLCCCVPCLTRAIISPCLLNKNSSKGNNNNINDIFRKRPPEQSKEDKLSDLLTSY